MYYRIINKVDLAPLVGANLDRMEEDMHRYNPGMKVFRTNLKTGEGLAEVVAALLVESSRVIKYDARLYF